MKAKTTMGKIASHLQHMVAAHPATGPGRAAASRSSHRRAAEGTASWRWTHCRNILQSKSKKTQNAGQIYWRWEKISPGCHFVADKECMLSCHLSRQLWGEAARSRQWNGWRGRSERNQQREQWPD